jgi:hypothetical protein
LDKCDWGENGSFWFVLKTIDVNMKIVDQKQNLIHDHFYLQNVNKHVLYLKILNIDNWLFITLFSSIKFKLRRTL